MVSNLPDEQKENWASNEIIMPKDTNNWGRSINKLTKAIPIYSSNGNFYTVESYSNNLIILNPIKYEDNTENEIINSYVNGMEVIFKSTFTNTDSCSVNVAGLGVKQIKTCENTDLISGIIEQGYFVKLIYDSNQDWFYFVKDNDDKKINNKANKDLDNLSEVGEKHILSLVYPIGSIYISVNEIDPSSLFGFGQWEKIKDKFLLASGDNYTNEETGGSSTVSLTTNQMPIHNHTASTDSQGAHTHSRGSMNIIGGSGQVYAYKPAGNGTGALSQDLGGGGCAQDSRNTYTGSGAIWLNAANNWSGETSSNGSHTHNITVYNTGAGEAHNNMPPYLAVNIWKRVA